MLEADLTDDALTGTMRVYQRRAGHRYSLDDVLTAREAARACLRPASIVDLGCGIGSVLLMVAYARPGARYVGVEAQELSFGLCQRNVGRNGLANVRLVLGDLRDPEVLAGLGGPFDLVTGTPPYMPPGTSTPSPDPQRAHARVELRGGVEEYLRAASQLLDERGRVVVCCDARAPERAVRGGAAVGLYALRCVRAVPRSGRAPLFAVWTFSKERAELETVDFVARDESGQRTDDYYGLRAFFGLPRSH